MSIDPIKQNYKWKELKPKKHAQTPWNSIWQKSDNDLTSFLLASFTVYPELSMKNRQNYLAWVFALSFSAILARLALSSAKMSDSLTLFSSSDLFPSISSWFDEFFEILSSSLISLADNLSWIFSSLSVYARKELFA